MQRLLGHKELKEIYGRRTYFAHESVDATSEELDKACNVIHRQLVDWGLANNEPPPPAHFSMTPAR